METFNVGDTVQLASGGPLMTVSEVGRIDIACIWFEGPTQRYGVFPPMALRSHAPPGSSVATPAILER